MKDVASSETHEIIDNKWTMWWQLSNEAIAWCGAGEMQPNNVLSIQTECSKHFNITTNSLFSKFAFNSSQINDVITSIFWKSNILL